MKSENAADFLSWRESLTAMEESRFFDLMRLYAGEVKTPYNKQKLIESLTAFLHKETNRKTVVGLLSQEDLMLISAVVYIPFCTREKAASFFSPHISFASLYNTLLNLEERLILFRRKDKDGSEYFDVNPFLRADIEPLIHMDLLFPQNERTISEQTSPFFYERQERLSSHILASWLVFVCSNPDLCRADGGFKKKAEELIQAAFSDVRPDFLYNLNTALTNLSLFRKNQTGHEADKQKWQSFAALPVLDQYAYICAALCGFQRRDILQKNAEHLIQLFFLLPEKGLSPHHVRRLIFLLQERQKNPSPQKNKFRQLLHENSLQAESFYTADPENLLSAAVLFGLVTAEADKNGSVFLYANPELKKKAALEKTEENSGDIRGSVSINAGFSITVLKELPLSLFIELISCADLEGCGTVSRFCITRSACFRAFSNGTKPEDIISLLQKTTAHNIPQNLIFSLNDWYSLFSSAHFYKGYVLQVSQEKRVLIENNPLLEPHIREKLAPGIYLLDFADDEKAYETIKKSSLEFIGELKNQNNLPEGLPFEILKEKTAFVEAGKTLFTQQGFKSPFFSQTERETFQSRHIQAMENELKKKNLPKFQEEELLLRIRRKTILQAEQLNGESVRVEKNEASGMDFLGKIRVIENAIACSDLIQITTGEKTVCGIPVKTEKLAGDTAVFIQEGRSEELQKISVAQARTVKRIRSSIFSKK
ncbi:hypothetical protein H0R92_03545 [Treponema sp. OMZ 840]|uniref:hypothetical protein n=1 Tax=Treponema sp. OMZ 840 TaxID=244313 RepID=UPI003D9208FD